MSHVPIFTARRHPRWVEGNDLTLLENGEEFFPAVFDAVRAARREVLIETFILFDDKVGRALRAALIETARRGVAVDLTVDGYGSPDLSPDFIGGLVEAGVRVHVFDPCPKLFGRWRMGLIRRLHRKLVVIDGALAFIGGINYSADHLGDFGPEAKQDYAVSLRGPLVAQLHRLARQTLPAAGTGAGHATDNANNANADANGNARPGAPPVPPPAPAPARRWAAWRSLGRPRPPEPAPPPPAGDALAMLVTRDNNRHPNDIERHYRAAIRAARREVMIANAYFFPGYRLLHEMRKAARRGVKVTLIVQGKPDMAIVGIGARLLYPYLLRAGVSIHEYCRRPLHGKVALVDDEWATVGSSNLDPLSLSLNLEANVIVRHAGFNAELRERLQALVDEHCTAVDPADPAHAKRGAWRVFVGTVVFHVLRHFPRWAAWLPQHRPRVETVPVGRGG